MTKGPTDWNDLLLVAGIDEVRRQLLEQFDHIPAAETSRDVSAARAEEAFPELELLAPDYDWLRRMKKGRDGSYVANIFNTQHVLMNDEKWQGVLGYCQFSYRVIKRKPPPFPGSDVGEWEDSDSARLRIWICQHYGFTPRTADADDAVLVVAQQAAFHPVREYLDSLEWDGMPRLDLWLNAYMGACSVSEEPAERERYLEYLSLAGAKWSIC